MKYSKFLKLLSALLCVVMLFVSCGDKECTEHIDEDANYVCDNCEATLEKPEPEPEPIEPKFENFFDLTYNPNYINFTEAQRLDFGKYIDKNGSVLLFKDSEIDNFNMVKDTYTVYDAETNAVLFTLEDSYENLAELRYIRDVEVFLAPGIVIKASNIPSEKLTPEELFELELNGVNNPGEYRYTSNVEFYTLAGEKISSFSCDNQRWNIAMIEDLIDFSSGEGVINIYIGGQIFVFDSLTYKMLDVYDATTEVFHDFDYRNEKYGYCVNRNRDLIRVYNLEDKSLVLTHEIQNNLSVQNLSVSVLDNGNIFVNALILPRFDEPDDYEFMFPMDETSALKARKESYIIDVETGKTTEVELDYFIYSAVETATDLKKYNALPITENAINVAYAYKIEDKKFTKAAILFLDNDMQVLYAYEYDSLAYDAIRAVREKNFTVLSTGDLLIELATNLDNDSYEPDYAIVKADGTLRCYVPKDATVIEGAIITSEGIYDYDLKPLFDYEDNEFEYVATVGKNIIVLELDSVYINDDNKDNGIDEDGDDECDECGADMDDDCGCYLNSVADMLKYYMITPENGVCEKTLINDEFVRAEGNYFITMNEDNGKYTLHNSSAQTILVTDSEMDIISTEDYCIAKTTIDNKEVVYILK